MIELLNEALHEITGNPVDFAVEFFQFVILMAIISFYVPRYVGPRLRGRRVKIIAELEETARIEKEYVGAGEKAAGIVARARQEASDILSEAQEKARMEREAAVARTGQEVESIILQAKQNIETEKGIIRGEFSQLLVDLVAETTRRFMDEALTESERHALTQNMILASFERMEISPLRGEAE